MCTFNLPPTNNRTVDINFKFVFITCGGCFSIIKVLKNKSNEMQSFLFRFTTKKFQMIVNKTQFEVFSRQWPETNFILKLLSKLYSAAMKNKKIHF